MKRLAILLFCFVFISPAFSQKKARATYKGHPVLVANKDTVLISVGEYRNIPWKVESIDKEDSIRFNSFTPLPVRLVSDIDSLDYMVGASQSRHFYVRLKQKYYPAVVYNKTLISKLDYKTSGLPDSIKFYFDKNYTDVPYFQKFRSLYNTDSCIQNAKDDATRVLNLLHWAHVQWKHDGNRAPQKNDAISILEEAKTGKGFPCFAYAEVLRAALNAHGIPTRRLALKTKTVETDKYASGHVVNEAYLRDLKKWVFIDPQEDIMPYLNGVPLNAVEFQKAATNNMDKLELKSLSKIDKRIYLDFVYPYLYYFDSNFDQRYSDQQRVTYAGKTSIMLVPKGSSNPTKAGFYNNQLINYCIYTNTLKDFYKAPVLQ